MSDLTTRASAIPAERLLGLLRQAEFLRTCGRATATGLRGVAGWLGGFAAVVLLDASVGFGARGLVTLDAALIVAGVGAAACVIYDLIRRRLSPTRTAAELERAHGLRGSELVNAVDLAAGAMEGTSEVLRVSAVKRGDELAGTVAPGAAVDYDAVRRAAYWAGAAAAGVLMMYLAFPRVFHAVVPRLLEPYADHPPFTLLDFAVTVEPDAVIQGHAAAIRVAIDGPAPVEQATLVWVDADGPPQRVPLLRAAAAKGDAESSAHARHFVLRLDRVEGDRVFYIDTPDGRSRRHTLDAIPVPLFEEVRVRYDFPAYTGWPSKREPLRATGLKAVAGTTATLEVRSNVPLDGGLLTVTPGKGVTASPMSRRFVGSESDRHVGTFPIAMKFDGEFEATLTSAGISTPEPLRARVVAVPDGAPRVSFAEPEQTVIAPEGWAIGVRVEASDDVGLSRLTLHRSVNGFAPTAIELTRSGEDRRRSHAESRFDLAALGARAGDVITYFATAYDNMPQPQSAQTPVQVIQVVSREEYEEFARTRYRIDDLNAEWEAFHAKLDALEAKREHALNELAALTEQLAAGEALTPEQRARVEQLEAELAEYRGEALTLAEAMRDRAEQNSLYEFEDAYKAQLRRTEQELQAQATEADATRRALRAMREQPSRDAATALAEQSQRFRERDQPFDEAMKREREQLAEDIERVERADAMAGAAERIRRVITQQRDLAERMQAFRGADPLGAGEQALANKLAEEQANLRDELGAARDALLEASSQSGDSLPKMTAAAEQLLQRLDALAVEADQSSASQNAFAGRGSGAAQDALTAAEKLESLLSDCQSMGGQASGDLDGCLGLPKENWNNALNQLAQGRGVPGMGRRGGEGTGFSGSAAKMAVMGPSPQGGSGDGPGRSGTRPSPGGAQGGIAADDETADDAERIDAEASEGRSGGVSVLTGVPMQYRETAEAYFRRLAEDERYDRGVVSPGDSP